MSGISSLIKTIFGLSEKYTPDFSVNCGKIMHVGIFWIGEMIFKILTINKMHDLFLLFLTPQRVIFIFIGT